MEEEKNVEDGDKDDEEEEEEEESTPGSTLFIKNLNFSTTEQTLQEVLRFMTTRLRFNTGLLFCDVDPFYFLILDIFQMWEGEILLCFQEKG